MVGSSFESQEVTIGFIEKAENPVVLSIPDHKTLDRGLLRALIRDAGLSVADFISLLD